MIDVIFYGRGNYISWEVNENVKIPEALDVNAVGELSEETMYWLDKIVELADNEKINLVFWVSPYLITEDEAKIFNAVEEYAKAKDIDFTNFNHITEKTGFDYTTDMIDRGHVNVSGCDKVTHWLGAYLQDKYQLPSHWQEEGYYLWELNAEAWRHRVRNHEMQQTQTLEECLKLDLNRYTAMTVRDGVVNLAGQRFYTPSDGVRVIVFDNLLDECADHVFCADFEQMIIER